MVVVRSFHIKIQHMTSNNQQAQGKEILTYFVLLVVGLYFFINGLMDATDFLIPIAISLMLFLICIPVVRKLERFGLSKGLSALICVVMSFITFLAFFALISFQISQFSDKWPEIKQKTKTGLEQIDGFVSEKTGFSFQEDINQVFPSSNQETESENKNASNQTDPKTNENSELESESKESFNFSQIPTGLFSRVSGMVVGFFSFLGSSTLVMIYLFFLLDYRNKLKLSILKFFKKAHQADVKDVLSDTIDLTLDFLVGRLILIAFLVVIYGVGLSISGIDNAILISILAAILSLIPYVGNVIGVILALAMAAFSGGEIGMYIGIAITFFIAQFVESYILQPYVVGGKVNINPFVTIVVVVLGGSIWGVAGMILSIPIIGIFKIICDAVPALQPIGYFLGEEDLATNEDDETSKFKKLGEKIWAKISGK